MSHSHTRTHTHTHTHTSEWQCYIDHTHPSLYFYVYISFLSFLFLHSLSPSISTKPFSLSMLLSFLNSRALCLSCSYLLSVCLSISPFLSFFLCPPPHLSISLSIYPLLNVGELRDPRYTDRRTYAFHGSVAKLLCNCLACTRFTLSALMKNRQRQKTKNMKKNVTNDNPLIKTLKTILTINSLCLPAISILGIHLFHKTQTI